jgi:hypothetical protein
LSRLKITVRIAIVLKPHVSGDWTIRKSSRRIVTFIQSSIERKSVRKRELLQLLGHFNFAARIIRPGRSFVSHLISLSTKVDKLHHFITLSKECREDLHMFWMPWTNYFLMTKLFPRAIRY